jgi:hypothetical protein
VINEVATVFMFGLLMEWKRGGIARAGRLTPQRSRQWALAGPQGTQARFARRH